MQRVPPSVQMQQVLTQDLEAGFAGHPFRQARRSTVIVVISEGPGSVQK
jgi:hypothetical protein